MKKKICLLAVIIILGASLGMQPAQASSTEFISEIKGIVTENGIPVNDPIIGIDCYGDSAEFHGKSDGTYSIHLKSCRKGKLVKVVAFAKDAAGNYTKEGYAQAMGEEITTVDVKIVPGHSVPEYNSVSAFVALCLTGGVLYMLRRKAACSE